MSGNMEYSKKVKQHFLYPKCMGEMKDADAVGMVKNPVCGDAMKVYIKVDKKTNKIKDIKFQTIGCAAAISSSDIACLLAKGKKLEDAEKIKARDILRELGGLPNIKEHCSLLGQDAIKKAIENYRKKK